MSEPSDMSTTLGEASPRRRRRLSIRTVMIGVVLGVALSLVVVFAVLMWLFRDAAPGLTQETLDEAVQRWESNGPADYNLQIKLTGRQEADIHIEVRDGKATAVTYNGRSPRNTTWEAWTVKGRLETIQRELTDRNEQTQKTFGVSSPSRVVLRAEFDPQLGYPGKYYRIVLNPEQSGSDRDFSWKIVKFEEVDYKAPGLTLETLDEAVKRWKSHGPADYNLQVKLSGRQEADIYIEVRDGKATAMTYDSRSPRPTTWETWTIKGQLETIQRELINRNERTQKTFGVSNPSQVVLRAKFDPQLGYPRRFYRVVFNTDEGESNREIFWQIVKFEEVAEKM